MRPKINLVENSPEFPDRVDVVVVGAGIVGCSAAYELARQGLSVALFEKGQVAGEQSGRNWGWVRRQNRAHQELELATLSVRRWDEICAEISADAGFRRSGILFCTNDDIELERWEKWGEKARDHDFSSQILSSREASVRAGGTTSWRGGVWSPSDGSAEPGTACAVIATGGKNLGVFLHQNCAVRGLDLKAGRLSGVWTEHGRVQAEAVVVAAGAWSSRFCLHEGISLPVVNIEGTAFQTKVAPDIGLGCLSTPNFALRRRQDGSFTIARPGFGTLQLAPQNLKHAFKFLPMYKSKVAKKLDYRVGRAFWNGPEALGGWDKTRNSPFEAIRILEPSPDGKLVIEALDALGKEFPQLIGVAPQVVWAGAIDTTPDLVPVISTVSTPGLIIASGFSGHGFALGPGSGKLIADLVSGNRPCVDPAPFRLSRFENPKTLNKPEMM
jgi:glycine/D-amino acid oxidase-like deaminating enzyme